MKTKLVFVCGLLLLTGSFLYAEDGAPSLFRTWKDATGNFSIEARILRIDGERVILELRDKKEISVPLVRLSIRDKEFVKTFAKDGSEKIINSIGMELIKIPAGTYKRGDRVHDPEIPLHEVTLSRPFHAGIYEVTQGQFVDIMGFNLSTNLGPNRPVDMVSWPEAIEFCKRLSDLPSEKSAGRIYRLPTEAEWEYICRAGTQFMYSFPDDDKLEQYAWFQENSSGHAHNVGQKKPNPWGLYDMHGNVSEWCMDWHAAYPTQSLVDPFGLSGSAVPFPKPGSPKPRYIRVVRGGSWAKGKEEAGSGTRSWGGSSHRHKSFGFRVLMFTEGGNASSMLKEIESRTDLEPLRMAEENYKQGKFEEMVSLYKWLDEPANNDPTHLERAHELLGNAWLEVGKKISMDRQRQRMHFQEAIKHFNLAIRFNPEYYRYHYLAAKGHQLNGEDEITIKATSHALKLLPKGHPKEVEILELRALAFENEGATNRSREDRSTVNESRYLSLTELKDKKDTIRSCGGIMKTTRDGIITDVMFDKHSQVSEDVFVSLKQINSLRALILNDTRITNEMLESTPALPNLSEIELRSTDIGDSGLSSLAKLKGLKYLNLVGTRISDAGLQHLSNLSELTVLALGSTDIGPDGLIHLGGLIKLRHLYLYDTKVEDSALKALTNLKDLNSIYLSSTNISDKGMIHLSSLRNLKLVNLEDTKVTDVGIRLLRNALPDCTIQR